MPSTTQKTTLPPSPFRLTRPDERSPSGVFTYEGWAPPHVPGPDDLPVSFERTKMQPPNYPPRSPVFFPPPPVAAPGGSGKPAFPPPPPAAPTRASFTPFRGDLVPQYQRESSSSQQQGGMPQSSLAPPRPPPYEEASPSRTSLSMRHRLEDPAKLEAVETSVPQTG